MKKLLCISPHLSTGGLPQFLLKKIKSLKDDYEIYCIEYSNHSGAFIVQRDQVQQICGDRFFSLGDDKSEILNLIKKINPDFIHFEEMPEYFMDLSLAKKIYTKNRTYTIIETSHDSSFDSKRKKVFPDKFIFVSRYQKQNVESLKIDSEVIEYPVGVKLRKSRDEGLNFLGLDVNKKHVFHVGLFTPRKNQQEFIEYARMMEDENVQFHCIGNMADNFKFYWEPLINNLPSNVKLWGERKDVDNFYSCMDLFLFTSRGHANDKETAPIVIKEAISYNVPSLLYNLPVYLNRYSEYSTIDYLDEVDFYHNVELIREKLNISEKKTINNNFIDVEVIDVNVDKKVDKNKSVIVISTHPYHKSISDTTKLSVLQAKKSGYKVILSSHFPVNDDIQNIVDYYIYDKNNPILKHNFYSTWNCDNENFQAKVNFKSCESDDYHGLAVLTNYYNGLHFAKSLGFDDAVCYNYDLIIDDKDFKKLDEVFDVLKLKKGFFFFDKALEGETLKTVFHGVNIDFYLDVFKYYTTEEYTNLVNLNQTSNGLEQFYYQRLKNNLNSIYVDYSNNEETYFSHSKTNIFSMVEYLTVLPVENEKTFVAFSLFNNKLDDRFNKIIIKKNGVVVETSTFEVKSKGWFYLPYKFENENEYEIENTILDENNKILRSYIKTFKTLEEIGINGYIRFKT